MVMKQHMSPETAQMFSQCVHRVRARDNADWAHMMAWLMANIQKNGSGFGPWTRTVDREFKFMHKQDAVMFALKWS